MHRTARWVLGFVLLVPLWAGCSGPPRFTSRTAGTADVPPRTGDPGYAVSGATRVDRERFVDAFQGLLGSRYRSGGTDENGFDCSGLVQRIYWTYDGTRLPRTVREMFRIGRPVSRDHLQMGDLVFYNTDGRGPSHVGIYLWDDTFVHASTSEGVTLSDVDDRYYGRRYLGARRLLY